MSVAAYFFAFDPRVYAATPTIHRWLELGVVDEELRASKRTCQR